MTQQGKVTSQEPGPNPAAGPGQAGLGDAGSQPGSPAPATGSPAGHEPAAVNWPSPYLPAGQAVPDAYPAPPQPGQHRYGAPDTAFQPGPGYPPAGRPGYGQRQPARPGMRPGRDPSFAAVWERFLACTVDWLLIFVAAVLPVLGPMERIFRQFDKIAVNSPALSPSAAQAEWKAVLMAPATTHTLTEYFLVLLGIALAYFWVLHAVWGATVGKRAFGLRVVLAADHSKIGVRAAGLRAVTFLIGPTIILFVPYGGWLGTLIWGADGFSALVDPRGQSLHDRAAGSTVIRTRAAR